MLPAQDHTEREESVSTLAGNLGSFAAFKMFSPLAGLREQLQAISLEEIAAADQQIIKVLEHLQKLQRLIDRIEQLRACQVEVEIAKNESEQILENSQPEVEGRPVLAKPSGNLAGLVTLRGISNPAAYSQSYQTTATPLKARIALAPTIPVMENQSSDQRAGDTPPTDDDNLTDSGTLARSEARATSTSSDNFSAATDTAAEGLPDGATEKTMQAGEELQSAVAAQGAAETINEEPVDFDQKLLDDLIKNYGEFVAAPNLPAISEPEPPIETDTEKPRVTMHAVQGGRATDKEPANRSQNDIDRQLKKIVKDYGDVDLYAQSSSLKTKLRVAAAFVVLATVLGGIYYFSKPRSADGPVADILQQRPARAAAETADKPQTEDGTKDADAEKLKPGGDNQPLQKNFEKGGTKR